MKLEPVPLALSVLLAMTLFLSIGSAAYGEPYPDAFQYKGLPLPYGLSGGFAGVSESNVLFLALDMVFWFLAALLMVYSAKLVLSLAASSSKKKR